ncbi:MAG: acyloxyacyl hydrolase [Prevotella sp.]|nr:acyloxyacyl hydrolase [Prevotella sp.]
MRHILYHCLLIVLVSMVALPVWSDTTMVHRLEADVVPSGVIQNNRYLRGENPDGVNIKNSTTFRLKYALQRAGNPSEAGAYAGIGVGTLVTDRQLGTPFLAYIVQGAPIVNFSRRVSLSYELNLGVAVGWKAYEATINETNHVVGSKVMSYIGADVFLRFMLSRHWDLNLGYGYAHSSNANLRMPNEGFNTMGGRVSLAYYFNRREDISRASLFTAETVPQGKHWAWDIVAYGGWKKRSLENPTTYSVAGISVSPTYRLNSAFALGPSIDGVYDESVSPKMSLGLQARAELTMPIFRASAGIGRYVVGGLDCFYETLAMKIDVSRHFFFNIGYCLYNYNYTNNLMLGIGLRLGT